MNNWLFDPFKGPYSLKKKGVFLFGIITFVVLACLEYTIGINHGHVLGSVVSSLNFPFYFTLSLLYFIGGSEKLHADHVSWHRRPHILLGLLFLSVSVLAFWQAIFHLTNNDLPDVAVISVVSVSILGMLAAFIRLMMVRRYRAKS